jgi:hypothetical protein
MFNIKMENFPGYDTDPKVKRTIERCESLGLEQTDLKQKKKSDRWYALSTLRGTKCTKSAARKLGTDPNNPGLTILYNAAANPTDVIEYDEWDPDAWEEHQAHQAHQQQDQAHQAHQARQQQDHAHQARQQQDHAHQAHQAHQEGGSYQSLQSDYRLRNYMRRHGLHWNHVMPVSFDLALALTSNPSRVLNATKITHQGNMFVPLNSI